jgi:hypothetical protein
MESTLIKDFTPEMTTLAVAFELSKASWKIGLQDSKREHPAMHTVADEGAWRLRLAFLFPPLLRIDRRLALQ